MPVCAVAGRADKLGDVRIWTLRGGNFLVEMTLARIPYVFGGVGLAGGERFDDSGTYVELTPAGEEVHRWGAPVPFPIDDYMTVSSIFRVIGGTLYHFYWQQARDEAPEIIEIGRPRDGLLPFDGQLPFVM